MVFPSLAIVPTTLFHCALLVNPLITMFVPHSAARTRSSLANARHREAISSNILLASKYLSNTAPMSAVFPWTRSNGSRNALASASRLVLIDRIPAHVFSMCRSSERASLGKSGAASNLANQLSMRCKPSSPIFPWHVAIPLCDFKVCFRSLPGTSSGMPTPIILPNMLYEASI